MSRSWPAWSVLCAAALTRLYLAAVVPLTDTTEARFAEMARKMVETGSWLVPQHDYGVPYLAKPPLAMWLSAGGIGVFGANGIAPRVPILFVTLGFVAALFYCARRWQGTSVGLTTLLVLVTSPLFFVSAGAVMTDMLLTAATTGALLAFYERQRGGGRAAEVAMYVAVGSGLLVKGPLVLVLVGAPIVAWSVALRRVGAVWQRFAWIQGALLIAVLAAPWYVAAELANPGFLHYFFVGEYLHRFLVPGWTGDLYGRAHEVPPGSIWLFFVLGVFPWPLLAVPMLWRAWPRVRRRAREHRDFVAFWLLAAATPLVLFTFAGNVIWPYALPALPPAALALAALLGADEHVSAASWPAIPAAIVVIALALGAGRASPFIDAHSQRSVVSAATALHPAAPVYYWETRYFSADYYGRGKIRVLHDVESLESELDAGRAFSLVIAERRLDTLPAAARGRLRLAAQIGTMVLFEPVRVGGLGSWTVHGTPQLAHGASSLTLFSRKLC